MKPEHTLLNALNQTGLITGAWSGMSFDDLPERVQEALGYVAREMRSEPVRVDAIDTYWKPHPLS